MSVVTLELQTLTLSDRAKIEQAISLTSALQSSPLSTLAFAPHFIWRQHFNYFWGMTSGWTLLFAEYADGMYMPLPPLGTAQKKFSQSPHVRYDHVVQLAFEFMKERNLESAVTRIENIPEEMKDQFEKVGCHLSSKDSDYLYRTEDLIALRGDRYKSQRAAYNQCVRAQALTHHAYVPEDREACLALFERWFAQKEQASLGEEKEDSWLTHTMLGDARSAHVEALTHTKELGLVGRVVRKGEAVCGYTLGYPRTPQVFCVLVEVTDRTIQGLAQYVFRELCRECSTYGFINTMDDSGLSSLAQSKRAYHPCQMVPNYIATMGS